MNQAFVIKAAAVAYIGPAALQRDPGMVLEQGNLLVRVICKTSSLLEGQGQGGKIRIIKCVDIMNHIIQPVLEGIRAVLLQTEEEMV